MSSNDDSGIIPPIYTALDRELFPGPMLKVKRAQSHIADLEALFHSFNRDNPHRIEVHENVDTPGLKIRGVFDKPLPPIAATILGDAIHNLRTALDHLACRLVEYSGGKITRRTAFPIYKTEAGLNDGLASKLGGTPNEIHDLVKSIKPYKTDGAGRAGNLLIWGLSELDIMDKHLLLIPTISVVSLRNIRVTNHDGSTIFTVGELNVSGDGNVDVVSVGGSGLKFEADSHATFGVFFANTKIFDGHQVIETLTRTSDAVSDVIDLFEAHYRRGDAT